MEWKKADIHEWTGDSFNRDSTVCSYTATGMGTSNAISVDNLFKISADGNLSIAKGCYDDSLTACTGSLGSVTIRDDFNTLNDSVAQLTASLQELKDAFEKMNKESIPRASKLRSALKTLNCKYEVM